jgi:hypothetical protein
MLHIVETSDTWSTLSSFRHAEMIPVRGRPGHFSTPAAMCIAFAVRFRSQLAFQSRTCEEPGNRLGTDMYFCTFRGVRDGTLLFELSRFARLRASHLTIVPDTAHCPDARPACVSFYHSHIPEFSRMREYVYVVLQSGRVGGLAPPQNVSNAIFTE